MKNGKISNLAQVASLRRYRLAGGKEDGLEVIDCDNGRLRFLLNVSKALDVMQVYHEGQNISFISKNGFSRREIPFLSRFEGNMVGICYSECVQRSLPHGRYDRPVELLVTESYLRRTVR